MGMGVIHCGMHITLLSSSMENFWSVSELLYEALNMVHEWCNRTQLSINPQTIVILPFTRKCDLRGLKKPTLSRHILQLTTDVKHLGLILDKGLTLKAQRKNVMQSTGLFGPLSAHVVKLGVWNPGWCTASTPWWSDLYRFMATWFGCWGSHTTSVGKRSLSYRDQPVCLYHGQWRWPQLLQWRSSRDVLLFMWSLRCRPRRGSIN